MFFPDDKAYLKRVTERTLQLMSEHDVVMTPQNYEIWFTYAAGVFPDLNKALDAVLNQGGEFSRKTSDELFERFFAPGRMATAVGQVSEQMQGELTRVRASLNSVGSATSKYRTQLAGASGSLQSSTLSAEALQIIVNNLVDSTMRMEKRTKELEGRLKESTEEVRRLQENLELVKTQSLTDPLTGIANRKALDDSLAKAMEEAKESNEPLAVVLADVDHFKSFNDRWGHQIGDQVLRLFAHVMRQNLKGRDTPARYGGEEFVIVLPKTELPNARTVAETIRKSIESRHVIRRQTGETLGKITVSFGCAAWRPGESIKDIIERADACLYAAKGNGRNQVVCEGDPVTETPKRAANG